MQDPLCCKRSFRRPGSMAVMEGRSRIDYGDYCDTLFMWDGWVLRKSEEESS